MAILTEDALVGRTISRGPTRHNNLHWCTATNHTIILTQEIDPLPLATSGWNSLHLTLRRVFRISTLGCPSSLDNKIHGIVLLLILLDAYFPLISLKLITIILKYNNLIASLTFIIIAQRDRALGKRSTCSAESQQFSPKNHFILSFRSKWGRLLN